jgi:hypothetical protein
MVRYDHRIDKNRELAVCLLPPLSPVRRAREFWHFTNVAAIALVVGGSPAARPI